jgi:hypothetical protein
LERRGEERRGEAEMVRIKRYQFKFILLHQQEIHSNMPVQMWQKNVEIYDASELNQIELALFCMKT